MPAPSDDFPASAPMPLTRDSIQVARLQEQVSQLRMDMAEMKANQLRDNLAVRSEIQVTKKQNEEILKRMDEAQAQAAGGWKLLLALGSIATGSVTLASWAWSHIKFTP